MSPPTSTSGSTSSLGTNSAARLPWRPSTSSTTAPTRVSCGAKGGGHLPGPRPPVTVTVTVPVPRGRGPGRHRRRDAAQGSGGHHQQLRADALPAAQGSSDPHPPPKPAPLGGSPPSEGSPAPPGAPPRPAVGRERCPQAGPPRHPLPQRLREPGPAQVLLCGGEDTPGGPRAGLGGVGVARRVPSSCCVPTGHQRWGGLGAGHGSQEPGPFLHHSGIPRHPGECGETEARERFAAPRGSRTKPGRTPAVGAVSPPLPPLLRSP